MKETVANALYDEIRKHPDPLSWITAEALARAGIAAMREPTETMRQAVREIGGPQWVANLNAVWPTAIAAALSEDEGKPLPS